MLPIRVSFCWLKDLTHTLTNLKLSISTVESPLKHSSLSVCCTVSGLEWWENVRARFSQDDAFQLNLLFIPDSQNKQTETRKAERRSQSALACVCVCVLKWPVAVNCRSLDQYSANLELANIIPPGGQCCAILFSRHVHLCLPTIVLAPKSRQHLTICSRWVCFFPNNLLFWSLFNYPPYFPPLLLLGSTSETIGSTSDWSPLLKLSLLAFFRFEIN